MAFPLSLDTFSTKVDGVTDVLAVDINNLQSSISALEAKVGVNGSAVASSLEYRLTQAPIGVGQLWVEVTGSRSAGVTYVNSTSKAIVTSIDAQGNNGVVAGFFQLIVNEVLVGQRYVSDGVSAWEPARNNLQAVVPQGASFRVVTSNASLIYWSELRWY